VFKFNTVLQKTKVYPGDNKLRDHEFIKLFLTEFIDNIKIKNEIILIKNGMITV